MKGDRRRIIITPITIYTIIIAVKNIFMILKGSSLPHFLHSLPAMV